MQRTTARRLPVLASLLLAAMACSGGGTAQPTTTPAPTSTTAAPTTSTTSPPTTTTEPAPTTTEPPPPVYPLTGMPEADPFVAARPALVVKIDNAPGARPQTGFNAADLVYEEIINDNLTRFALVFHSQGSDPVGPVRSGRLQDVELFGSLNRPLFAWSGGNATVNKAVRESDFVDLVATRTPGYYRRDDRKAPHNLYSNTSALWGFTPPDAQPPPQHFVYRAEGVAPLGVPHAGVDVALDSIDVTWRWDATSGVYVRTMEGKAHMDGAGGQVSAHNVVVLVMEYVPGISNSPDAQAIGSGEAFVFSGGHYIRGTWSRADRLLPWVLMDYAGRQIPLTPGRTFIELPRAGFTTPVP